MPKGEYKKEDLYIGLPSIVGAKGVRKIMNLNLREDEKEKLNHTCDIIGDLCHSAKI